jgi:GT2 family glycosyltransferase
MKKVDLSVVAIGLNEGAQLLDCLLAAAKELKALKRPYELIYVDSRSTDDSVENARNLGVQVIQAGRFGAARARNAGWQAARGAFVQFLDGDMCVEPGWFAAGLKALEEPGVGAVFGRLRELRVDTNPYCAAFGLDWNKPVGDAAFFGGAVMVRRDAIAGLGGYDETLRVGEDPELSLRFRQAGLRILSVDAPMATHDLGIRYFSDYWRRANAVGKSRVLVFKKRISWKTAWRATSSLLSLVLLSALLALAVWVPYGLPALTAVLVARWFRLIARDLLKGGSWVASIAHGSHLAFGKVPEAQGALFALLRR